MVAKRKKSRPKRRRGLGGLGGTHGEHTREARAAIIDARAYLQALVRASSCGEMADMFERAVFESGRVTAHLSQTKWRGQSDIYNERDAITHMLNSLRPMVRSCDVSSIQSGSKLPFSRLYQPPHKHSWESDE